MRTIAWYGACFGLLCADVARADLPPGSFAPDIEAREWLNAAGTLDEDDIPSLAELRGMVVVLFFWVSFHAGGESVMTQINIVENNPELGRKRGVFVLGLTDADRKRIEGTLKKEKAFFPVGVESKAHEDYQISSFPRVVIVDAEGKVAWSGWPGQGDELIKAVLEGLSKTPPTKTHPAEARLCHQHLAEARHSLRNQDYRAAFRSARDAFECALTGDPLKTSCQDMLDLVEALGRDKLADAALFVDEGNFDEAVRTLRYVSRSFRGMTPGRDARKRLKSLKQQYQQVAEILKDQEGGAKARSMLLAAVKDIKGRRFGRAYGALQTVLEDHAHSEAAAYAEGIVRRMRKNPTVMAYVRDYLARRDCESWLSQGRSYSHAGRYEKARELFRRVIDEYPHTKYADQATRRLAELP